MKFKYLSNLWIIAYIIAYMIIAWRHEPFQRIQFDLVNCFDWFTKKIRLNRTICSRTGHHKKKRCL